MIDFTQEKQKLKALLTVADRENILAHNAVEQLEKQLRSLTAEQTPLKNQVELMKMGAAFLQQLIDTVATDNINNIETLVNTALASIFKDQDIAFKIVQEIKRNQVLYKIILVHNGVEGGINSFGGGPWGVVALVLKAVVLILGKRYPVLALDESLSYVSKEYRESVSHFLHDLTKPYPAGLSLPILLVSHEPQFNEAADNILEATPAAEGSVKFLRRTQ
jgi:DNA repair exonuclease SbcCD ATPase subunit